MRSSRILPFVIALLCAPLTLQAQQASHKVGPNAIGGVVSGPNGPEAGVWVIAQTTDLPTPYAKVVVTDDKGRYLIPELPKANYSVWARGYGLSDSAKTQARWRRGLGREASKVRFCACLLQF